MEVIVNRTPVAARDGATLSELLAALGTPADGVAVAVNNRVVPRSEWTTAILHEADKVTIIRAVCGG
ncbi:sulfur carrier protein ThiS [uncultured Alistipes sp.]|uniref:sulfur carrier protein ThiS n=1 Tax=uncultured Alistipes sp. TaxID=538949 RepID=UPI000E9E8179|nr:sulfur carrier protein ThiS [uncultured Alistipes sp.]HBL70612.1 thiamine biosynthesis protein ThiS [Alistipes sp.]HBW00767.1 thiamine biosynthesis protein ThiS [Alistipes sp.]